MDSKYQIEKVTYGEGRVGYWVLDLDGDRVVPFGKMAGVFRGFDDLKEARGLRGHLQWELDKKTEISKEIIQ